jgi:hypothetical protein
MSKQERNEAALASALLVNRFSQNHEVNCKSEQED